MLYHAIESRQLDSFWSNNPIQVQSKHTLHLHNSNENRTNIDLYRNGLDQLLTFAFFEIRVCCVPFALSVVL